MTADVISDRALLDRPDVLACLFHPRRGFAGPPSAGSRDLAVPVAEGVTIGARFHSADPAASTILFFHGKAKSSGQPAGKRAPSSTPAAVANCQPPHKARPAPK